MLRVFTFMILIVPLVSTAQTDSTGLIITPHLATPVGKPVDKAVTVKMNKEGGTIKSGDGRVELIFPEGAVSSKTNISIQPISNHAAGGVGNGYEFSPSGIKFNKPVQLIMHYKEHELEGTQARFKNIATQHKDGKWYKLKTSVDTITHSIVCSISHFSSYAAFDEITITPKQAKLKVSREVLLVVTYNYIADAPDEDDLAPLPTSKPNANSNEDDLAPLPVPSKIPPLKWFVNSIPNGNAVTGIIRVVNNQTSEYYAPATVPDANPVAVTVDLKGISFNDNVTGKTFKDLTLVSNITIYDKAYQISILGSWGVAGDDLEKITDTSSFILHLNGNKNSITNIQNMFEVTIKNMPGCTSTYMNEANATGVIHISGIESITVVPADPPRQPARRINIKFKKPQIIMPDIHIKCKGAWINNELMSALLEDFKMGFPWTISFMENELKDKWATEAGIEEYQVKIRPLSED